MNKERKNKSFAIIALIITALLAFGNLFYDHVYAEPDTETPITPVEPENPVPAPHPQPVPQPVDPPQGNENVPQQEQNLQNTNRTENQEMNDEKTDTRLLTLSIECGNLNPDFSPDVYSYIVYVNPDAENKSCVTYAEAVEPELTSIDAKGPKTFGKKNIRKVITVEAENGSKSEYVINIHVLKSNEFLLGNKLIATPDFSNLPENILSIDKHIGSGGTARYIVLTVILIAAIGLGMAVFKKLKDSGKIMPSEKYKKENEAVFITYAVSVVLNYFDAVKVRKNFCPPSYFGDELKLGDTNRFVKKMEKKHLIQIDLDSVISLTSKGRRFLNIHSDYVRFFSLAVPEISISDYQMAKDKNCRDESFEMIMLRLVLKKISELDIECDYVAIRKLHYNAAVLYKKLNYMPQALYHCFVALYIDISGCKYHSVFRSFVSGNISARKARALYTDINLSPYLISEIREMASIYNDEMIQSVFNDNKLEFTICSMDMYRQLINDIISGEFLIERWQNLSRIEFDNFIRFSEKKDSI